MISDEMIHEHVRYLRENYKSLTQAEYKKLAKENGYMSYSTICKVYKSWKNVILDKDTSTHKNRYPTQVVHEHVAFLRENYSFLSIDDYDKLAKEKGYMAHNTIYKVYKSWKNVFPDKDPSTHKKKYTDEMIHEHVRYLRENYKNLTIAEYNNLAKEKDFMLVNSILNLYKKWSAIFPEGKKPEYYSDQAIQDHVEYLKKNYPVLTAVEYNKLAKEKKYMSSFTIYRRFGKWSSIYPSNKECKRKRTLRYSDQEIKGHVKYLRKNYPNISRDEYSLLSKEKKYMSAATILRVYEKWTEVFPDGKLRKKIVKISDEEIHKHVEFLRDEYGYMTGPNYTKLAKEKKFMSYRTIVNLYKKWSNVFPSGKREGHKRKRMLRYSDQEVRDHVKFVRKNYPNISNYEYNLLSKEKKYMSAATILRVYKKWTEVLPD